MAEETSWLRSSDAAFGTKFIHVISKSFRRGKQKLDIYFFLFKKETHVNFEAFKNIAR